MSLIRRFSMPLVWCLLGCELFRAEAPPAPPSEPAERSHTEITVTKTEPSEVSEPPPADEPPRPPEPRARDGVYETDEQTRGRLAPAKITPVLEAHGPAFNQCYAAALAESPGISGSVALLIVISPEGAVPHAEVLDDRSTLEHPGVRQCLIREAKTLRFEKPVGGRVVTEYPLVFEPAPESAGDASLPAKSPE